MKLILIANIFLQMIDVTPTGLWICRPYVTDMTPLRGYGYAAPTLRICRPYGAMDMAPLWGYGRAGLWSGENLRI